MSDLCWVCQNNSMAIMTEANRPHLPKPDVGLDTCNQTTHDYTWNNQNSGLSKQLNPIWPLLPRWGPTTGPSAAAARKPYMSPTLKIGCLHHQPLSPPFPNEPVPHSAPHLWHGSAGKEIERMSLWQIIAHVHNTNFLLQIHYPSNKQQPGRLLPHA